jgi:hypothetical protein
MSKKSYWAGENSFATNAIESLMISGLDNGLAARI